MEYPMTESKQHDLDRYEVPPDATFHLDAAGDEPFAIIGDDNAPEEFFLRDDTGKWHCVQAADYYAAFVWRFFHAEVVIKDDGGLLSIRFADWADGPEVIVEPILWPEERRAAS